MYSAFQCAMLAATAWKHNEGMQSGVDCRYYPIDTCFGLKTFYCREMRDHSYELQNLFHEHGIAPKALTPFEYKVCNYGKWCVRYGYQTEIATIAWTLHKDLDDRIDYRAYKDEISDITQRLGYLNLDLHDENWGFMPYGPVVTDFGHIEKF